MDIQMSIQNIKSIKKFDFNIPTIKGLYALTGENGSGKSTVISCMSQVFYDEPYQLFGRPDSGSKIIFTLGQKKKQITSFNRSWNRPIGSLGIKGFFEGSLVYGYRFKDTDIKDLKKLSYVPSNLLNVASNFIRENFGLILHDDRNYYEKLYLLKQKEAQKYGFRRPPFYCSRNGKLVNQLYMSTGENLLLTILYSIELRLNKKNTMPDNSPDFILFDEIELALHSSALRRLVFFLKKLAEENNFVVFFSTHSIELIRSIEPKNIFYLQRYLDNSLSIINPCYPVYATRNLEASNYGHDYIIMVEDNLAKTIVDKILSQKRLLGNKKILVIAVGGWMQVLRFAYDTISSNLALKTTKIVIVLDRDIKEEVPKFMKAEHIGFEIPPNFLPVQSLEKYLVSNLVDNVDHELYSRLDNYIFQKRSLSTILSDYSSKINNNSFQDKESIKNGKALFGLLQHELEQTRKTENDLSEEIVQYLFEKDNANIKELTEFLTNTLS